MYCYEPGNVLNIQNVMLKYQYLTKANTSLKLLNTTLVKYCDLGYKILRFKLLKIKIFSCMLSITMTLEWSRLTHNFIMLL